MPADKVSESFVWVQQLLRRKEFRLLKDASEADPADLFAKHFESRAKLDQLVGLFNCRFIDGQAGRHLRCDTRRPQ